MERLYFQEMKERFEELSQNGVFRDKKIYLFGHCNATEELAKMLAKNGYLVTGILDNSVSKQGGFYLDIPVISADTILSEPADRIIVCIAIRFYESMHAQLRKLGYKGEICKMVEYNTYAEYSLSDDTIKRKWKRVERGQALVADLKKQFPGYFRIYCPFSALGDVYYCMSYLPYFLKSRGKEEYIMCVAGNVCKKVVLLFDECPVEVMEQKELDAAIQAELYMKDENAFIAHQDRPYVVNLSKALYLKRIPLEQIYCCGVFGLPRGTEPVIPERWTEYGDLDSIEKNHAVILSPYAKSVTALSEKIWEDIVSDYAGRGYQVFTNVAGDEKPLAGTKPISPAICEMKSVVERAGVFVGIRSGLCDVIRTARCRKIALYPEYNYCDTKWKAIDMYAIGGFENIVVREDFVWKRS